MPTREEQIIQIQKQKNPRITGENCRGHSGKKEDAKEKAEDNGRHRYEKRSKKSNFEENVEGRTSRDTS